MRCDLLGGEMRRLWLVFAVRICGGEKVVV
jgi:hypothetical protein